MFIKFLPKNDLGFPNPVRESGNGIAVKTLVHFYIFFYRKERKKRGLVIMYLSFKAFSPGLFPVVLCWPKNTIE